MTETLPPDAVSADTTIAAIAQRYTPDEIAAHIRSFVGQIANGSDAAADDLAAFIATLPKDWNDEHSC
jgi:hypothetical protein